ncbi:unnamed protein product [Brassica oleracea var. botrytis]|uniref:(rape) hypothetical protein n=1 Tax=Brassica napus TaxID=3708 RepID=A0A078HZX4_BRANA|nr:unnamed protein product [Brassica napus]CDY42884.1 BnaC08g46880D [Brassica napus]
MPIDGLYYRRAHSEVQFRLPEDLDLPVTFGGFNELGSEDDFFCSYMDIEKSDPDPTRLDHLLLKAKKAMALDKVAELWVVDPKRAKRMHRHQVVWNSNPTRHCPNCHHVIDNSYEVDDWPGLPRGVKFDPSDPEIICHLLAKSGLSGLSSHPFTNELISAALRTMGLFNTVCVPLFHRTIKTYNTRTRKRRKIHYDDFGDVSWHKTGRTKPVVLDGAFSHCHGMYPIPVGPTLQKLMPAFYLSTLSQQHLRKALGCRGTEPSIKLMLPNFGLASSKRVQVDQPDYSFFTCNSPPMR